MLSRRKQTNQKKTKRCLAWQLDEVRGATRYKTIATAFLWQLTSCSFYKKSKDMFILSLMGMLRAYSGCISVEARFLGLSYLKQRTENLGKTERLVTLKADEDCTANGIGY